MSRGGTNGTGTHIGRGSRQGETRRVKKNIKKKISWSDLKSDMRWTCTGTLSSLFATNPTQELKRKAVIAEVLLGPSVVFKGHPLYIYCPVRYHVTNQT